MNLSQLHKKIEQRHKRRNLPGKAVPGEGPSDAAIMLIGQNPGQTEAKTGRPFVGRSGKYLERILQKNNIDREKIFITSVVKHATPQNKKPSISEIREDMPILLEQINLIRPKIIVLMGTVAWRVPRENNIRYIETHHPAAALRFEKSKVRFEQDIKHLAELLSHH